MDNNERDVKEKENRFRSFFDNSLSGIALHKIIQDSSGSPIDYVFLEVNKAFEAITGLAAEDIVGKSFLEVFPQRPKDPLIEKYGDVALSGQPISFEYYFEPFKKHFLISAFSTEKGYFAVSFNDITESKLAEKALKENEEKLKQLSENLEEVFWVGSPDWKEVYHISKAYEKVWGRTCQSLYDKGYSWMESVVEEDKEKIERSIINIIESDFTKHDLEDYRIIRPDGQVRWISSKAFPIRGEKGNVCRIAGIASDVTEQKKAFIELKEKDYFLSQINAISKIGGWEMDMDQDGKAKWTKGTYDIVEIEENEPIPGFHEHVEWYLPEYRQMIKDKMQELADTGQPMTFEAMLKTRKGNLKWCYAVGEAVKKSGKVVKLRGTFQDITERKNVEQQLLKQQYYLSRAQQIANLGTWEIDVFENDIVWTEQAYKIFGLPQGKKLGLEDFLGCVHPEDREYVLAEWNAAVFEKKPYDIEHRIISNDEVRWVREKAELEFDETGKCVRGTGFTQDITDSVKTKKKLQESLLRERDAVEGAGVGLWSWDMKTNKVWYSAKWKSQIGYDDHEIGDSFDEWKSRVHPDDLPRALKEIELFREHEQQGRLFKAEFRLRHKNGTYRWIVGSGTAVKDAQGNLAGIRGSHVDITELRKAQDKLVENEARLKRIIESGMIGVAFWDKNGKIREANSRFLEMFGFEKEEMLSGNLDWKKMTPQEYLAKDEKILEELAEKGVTAPFEKEYFNKQGKRIPVLVGAATLPGINDAGVALVLDITKQKQIEQQIKNLAKFPEENPNPVMRITKNREMIYSNAAAKILQQAWHYEEGGLLSEEITSVLNKALKTGKIQRDITNCPDGRVFAVDFAPIVEGAYVNIYALDITERIAAEKQNIIIKERFYRLFDNMTSGVAIYEAYNQGEDFIIKDFNKAGERIEKINRQDIINKRVTEAFPGVRDFGLLDIFRRVYQTGESEHFPAKIYKDARIAGWRENYVYRLPSGEVIAVYDDVTDKKQAEQREREIVAVKAAAEMEKRKARELFEAYAELKRTQEQLIQAEKLASIGQLGAGVAHELNSPLAGVLSLLRSYRKEKDQSSEEYKDLGEMEKACEHMAKIIKGLNSFARQSTGEIEPVDCNRAIEATLVFTGYKLEKKNIAIRMDLQEGLPLVRANENQIQQVIINLVTNACDSVKDNGNVKISTHVVEADQKKYVEMAFEDNGSGIRKDDLSKIFDPFFTTKRPGGGIGLGLSIVYKIIENHNGRILVDSEEGKGTVFKVRLPADE